MGCSTWAEAFAICVLMGCFMTVLLACMGALPWQRRHHD
jgi:hypothetical protein